MADQNDKPSWQKLGYSIKEAAEVSSLSYQFLRREINAGKLKVQRFGRRIVILSEDLQNYLNKR